MSGESARRGNGEIIMSEKKEQILTVSKITKGLKNDILKGEFHAHVEAYECNFNCSIREVIYATATILVEAENSLPEKRRKRFRADFLSTLNDVRRAYNDTVNSKK